MWRGIHDGAHSLAQILYNIHHYCVRSGMDIWEVTKGSLKETSELQMGAAGGGLLSWPMVRGSRENQGLSNF
jgi:hypothetical protein